MPTDTPLSDADRTAVVRILDANANRATEGLRVVEDYLRFVLDDGHLCGLCKELRHALTAQLEAVPVRQRWAARETLRDVGTTLTTPSETCRESPRAVAAANLARVAEALRCLEEYAKVLRPDLAAGVEALRYRTYTLARAVALTAESCQRLAAAHLYVLVDGRASAADLADLVRQLLAGGADVIQLRDKRLPDRELVERARLIRPVTREAGALLIVNDRPDLAVLADADGVHVGQDELPVKDARVIVGPDRLIGVSTHALAQARQAVLDGANYLGCGPTFPSRTKAFPEFPGIAFLRQVAAEIRLPAFAIGGITAEQVPHVRAAGFTRIAVSGAVVDAPDPRAAVARLRGELLSSGGP